VLYPQEYSYAVSMELPILKANDLLEENKRLGRSDVLSSRRLVHYFKLDTRAQLLLYFHDDGR
jgi:hypothetical protein